MAASASPRRANRCFARALALLVECRPIDQRVDFGERAVLVTILVAMSGRAVTYLSVVMMMVVRVVVCMPWRTVLVSSSVCTRGRGELVVELIFAADAKSRGGHACARDALGPDGIRGDREAAQGAAHVIERHADVDQRAENHVAGSAREAIEVQGGQPDHLTLHAPAIRPRLDEREVALIGQDEMIDDVDADDEPGVDHARREDEVVGAWRGVAGRMVVKQDDDGRRGGDRLPKDLARVHNRRVERAERDDLDPNESMLRVEHRDAELLDRARAVLRQQERGNLLRRVQSRTFVQDGHERPPPELHGCQYLCGARAADASQPD